MRILLLALALILFSAPAYANCNPKGARGNPSEGGKAYFSLADHGASSTEASGDYYMVPVNMLAHTLYVEIDVAPGVGNSWVLTLRNSGVSTDMTCTIENPDTSCTYTGDAVSIAAGTTLNLEVNAVSFPTAAAEIELMFCLEKDNT
jgi:hypothetical protein